MKGKKNETLRRWCSLYNYNKDKNEFTKEMLSDTLKYQRKYGFDIGQNNVAWNNEADAFRHTYMQSILSKRYGILPTKIVSSGLN